MEKFVIVMVEDDTGVTKYWDGRVMQDDKNACFLFNSKAEARSVMGRLVSTYSNCDLMVRKARYTLDID